LENAVSLNQKAVVLFSCLVTVAHSGCGASRMSSARMAPAAMVAAAQAVPAPLDHSVFDKNPYGQLSEEKIQQILAAPIELVLPARVGVLPVITASDWRGPSPDFGRSAAGVTPLVNSLRKTTLFNVVTQMMPIPSGALGMEALREAASRYRLRYLILYREVIAPKTRLNGWAFGYATGIGAMFLPGKSYSAAGYIEASMFDVKTGLLLFTSRRSITASRDDNEWHEQDKLAALVNTAIAKFSPELGSDVLSDLTQFQRATEAEAMQRMESSPVAGSKSALHVAAPSE
jgi:hypothetical protein